MTNDQATRAIAITRRAHTALAYYGDQDQQAIQVVKLAMDLGIDSDSAESFLVDRMKELIRMKFAHYQLEMSPSRGR